MKWRFVLLIGMVFGMISSVYALIILDDTEVEFDLGTYTNTYWNNTHVALNITEGFYNGTYSQTHSSVGAVWDNITWWSGYGHALEKSGNASASTKNDSYIVNPINYTGLVAYLPLDDDSKDYSGEGSDGTQSGGVLGNQSGQINTAHSFDGIDDYLDLGNTLDFVQGDNFTFSFWLKVNSLPGSGAADDPVLFFKGKYNADGYYIQIEGNIIKLQTNGAGDRIETCKSNSIVTIGKWEYWVVTLANDTCKIYKNRILDDTATGYIHLDSSTDNFQISKYADVTDKFFLDGSMDEVSIWNRSLSPTEVSNLYQRGATRLNLSITNSTGGKTDCGNSGFYDLGSYTDSSLAYNFTFETDNLTVSPELWNVSIDYTAAEAGDTEFPIVTLENSSFIWTADTTPTVYFNVTDETAATLSCVLYFNNVSKATNGAVANATSTSMTSSALSNGNYSVNVNCSDGTNTNTSDTIWVYVDYTAPSPPSQKVIWRNKSSGINVSWIDWNGNMYLLGYLEAVGNINSTGTICDSTGCIGTNTNCSVAGSCPSVAYMDYENDGNLNVTGNITADYYFGSGAYLTDLDISDNVTSCVNCSIYSWADGGFGFGSDVGIAGDRGTYIGEDACNGCTDNYITAIGARAGDGSTGAYATMVGRYSGADNSGARLTSMGYYAGNGNNGTDVCVYGYGSGSKNIGDRLIAVGRDAGQDNNGTDVIAIGHHAGENNSGDDSIFIGYEVGKDNTQNDRLMIDNENTNTPLIDGDFANDKLTINGNLNVTGNFTGNQIYGGMWYHNHTATTFTFAVQDTWYPLFYTEATDLNGFSYVGGFGQSSNLTAQVSGKYQASYMAIGSGINNHIYLTTILIDGVEKPECGNHRKIAASGDVLTQSGVCIITINAGQTIQVATQDMGSTGDGEYYGGNINLIRIAN